MSQIKHRNVAPFDFFGLNIRELTPENYSIISLAEIEVPPGVKHKTARSLKSDKVYYCNEGEVLFTVDGKAGRMERGDVLLIEKGTWFDYTNTEDKTSRMILIHIPPFNIENEQFRD
jgi:mannose-6-phosphate isomerase-like protein (cupin superfamily)